MSWKTHLSGFGVTAALTTSLVLDGGMPANAIASSGAEESADVSRSANRINELVAAYDQTAKKFDPSKVSSGTLVSDEGRAFLAVVGPDRGSETPSSDVESSFAALRDALTTSDALMSRGTEGDPLAMSFSLAPGVVLTFPSPMGASARVSGGADPWPYVQLTGAEQQAMITGASGTLIVAICALLGPASGGIGCGVGAAVIGTIVGIIVANGVCANNREMRIYPLLGPGGFSCQ